MADTNDTSVLALSTEVDFSPFGDWTPHAGDRNDVVPFDGFVAVKITRGSGAMSKPKMVDGVQTPARPMAVLSLAIQDEDAKGLQLIARALAGGTDKSGQPLARQLMDVLHSTGTEAKSIQQLGKEGQKMTLKDIVGKLEGKTGYVEIRAGTYNGSDTTEVVNWVSAARYEELKAVNGHRKQRRAVAASAAETSSFNMGGDAAAAPADNGAANLTQML